MSRKAVMDWSISTGDFKNRVSRGALKSEIIGIDARNTFILLFY